MGNEIHILGGEPPVEVLLKRSRRARRFTLRVSRSSGQVTLSMPHGARQAEALAFLDAREGWVRKHLAASPAPARPEIGGVIPVEGRMRQIVPGTGRSARLIEGRVELPEGQEGPRMAALLKQMARDRLVDRSRFHADRLGRSFGRITLRDTRSRWGSCSSKGDLMYCWRLIMAPPAVLDYVAAHEVAHLAEMNHSPAFWAVCERLCPGYQPHRDWLRRNGAELLAWRFDRLP
ncbi:M48 family metallopeptidase [Nioella sp.]|uniref:M48 family metallopeptidase n=1 Tax=Nioella sp. TaxID=1912091 RepID=UPI003A89EC5E